MRHPSRALAIGLVVCAACGTARVIQRTPSGGVIELDGDHNKAMEHANEQMAALCDETFIVVKDGYEPISTAPAAPGASVPTAFRIHYQCGDGSPAGSAAPARPPE
jgi:hypothetical protein